ncbi:MAG: GrpB family protein [Phycisphaerae bacterium]
MSDRRPIIIENYNPAWPALAAEQARAIAVALGPLVIVIEHIGSTAVPGLAAKPVLDLMVAIRDLSDSPRAAPLMQSLGFEYVPKFEATLPMRRFFRKDTAGVRTRHIHMVEITSEFWRNHIAFRDALRDDPLIAHAYADLKRRLAQDFVDDVAAYTDGKADFVRDVIARRQLREAPPTGADSR